MWKIYVIIGLFLIALFVSIFLGCKKHQETYDKPKKSVPPKPHGIDNKPFPKFPLEISSDFHHDIAKERLSKVAKCGKCQELEQKLLQNGQNAITRLRVGRFTKPNLQIEYANYLDCEMCRMLLQTWDRYFTILHDMSNYIYDKKLPQEPKIVKMLCSGCNDIQKKDKEYADNLKKELTCRESGSKDCSHVKFTGGSYNFGKNCKECEKMYNTWQLYIFSIIALVNYYRFNKQNLKPIA